MLHSHVADKELSGGTNPDSHTSRKRSRCERSQPKLWSAAGFCARGPVEPNKLWSLWWEEESDLINSYPPTKHRCFTWFCFFFFLGGRNLPRSLLGPNISSDSEGGVFAIPTTLPPNSSRHNRMFSPNKEAELFRQQLDSISVRRSSVWLISYLTASARNE